MGPVSEVPAMAGQTSVGDDAEAERREEERLRAEQAALDAEGGNATAPESSSEPAPAPEELTLRGNEQLSFFKSGGKKPGTSTLTLRSKTIDVEKGTGFKKGTRVKVEAIFVVDANKDQDSRDKATGMVTDAVLKSSAFLEDIKILEIV